MFTAHQRSPRHGGQAMANRELLRSIVVVALMAVAANAQETKLLLVRAGAPAGTTVIDAGTTSATQTVIPRYRTGTSYPAGQVIGWGPQSLLTGTADTASLPIATTRSLVITEGFGEAMSQWQTTSTGKTTANLQPRLANLTVAGYSTDGWASGGSVNDAPFIWNKTSADLYAGFLGLAGGGEVSSVNFFYIPGTACYLQRPGSTAAGAIQPFDKIKWAVEKIGIARVFRGLHMDATDSCVQNVEVFAFRDYGVRLGTYQTTGAVQFARLHAYGGGMLAADNTGTVADASGLNGVDSPAIWIDGDTCHGVDCYGENAPVGLYIKGSYAALDGFYSHTCSVANLVFAGAHAHVSKARLDVLGDEWNIAYDTEAGGSFEVNKLLTFGGGATGTLLALTDNGTTGTMLVRQISGTKPVDNESITSGTPAVTALVNGTPTVVAANRVGAKFANQYNTLSDSTISPAGSSTAIVISDGTRQIIRDVTINSFGNASGIGINANATLTNCHIDITISGGAIGIDFSDTDGAGPDVSGDIGAGNVIRVNTANGTTTAATLPANWNTTPNTTTVSKVFINGVQYFYNP